MVAFLALNLFERSLNVVSLAGLAFAVGLVLDAAIIVQENIARLTASGMAASKATLKGATQVGGLYLLPLQPVSLFFTYHVYGGY